MGTEEKCYFCISNKYMWQKYMLFNFTVHLTFSINMQLFHQSKKKLLLNFTVCIPFCAILRSTPTDPKQIFLSSLKTKVLSNNKSKNSFSNLWQKKKKMKSHSKKFSFYIQYFKPCGKVPNYFLTILISLDSPFRRKVSSHIYLEGCYLSSLSLLQYSEEVSLCTL